jgi:hypothetical protein
MEIQPHTLRGYVAWLERDDPRYITWLYVRAVSGGSYGERKVTFEGNTWLVNYDGFYENVS